MKTKAGIISRAFSLVEVLVILAIIGIIVAIAIPSIDSVIQAGKKSAEIREQMDKENAQRIVHVFERGRSAGIDWVSSNERMDVLISIRQGMKGEKGPNIGKIFRLCDISSAAFTSATRFVGFDGEDLYFDPAGEQTLVEF